MQELLVSMLEALAVWRIAETGATQETSNVADLKAAAAQAADIFIARAYDLCFEITPYLLRCDNAIKTMNGVRYSASPANGGFVLQQMEPDSPGVFLTRYGAPIECFLQLAVDLRDILQALRC